LSCQFSVSFLYLEGSSKKKQSGGLQSKTTDELPVSKLYIWVGLIRKERSIYMLIHFMYKRSMLEKWHQEQWLAHLSNTSLFKKCRSVFPRYNL
jgi:hypothetical protein